MNPITYLESLGYEVEFEEARLCLYVVTYGTEEWEPMEETELEAFARERGWQGPEATH